MAKRHFSPVEAAWLEAGFHSRVGRLAGCRPVSFGWMDQTKGLLPIGILHSTSEGGRPGPH